MLEERTRRAQHREFQPPRDGHVCVVTIKSARRHYQLRKQAARTECVRDSHSPWVDSRHKVLERPDTLDLRQTLQVLLLHAQLALLTGRRVGRCFPAALLAGLSFFTSFSPLYRHLHFHSQTQGASAVTQLAQRPCRRG